jgi:hypothetical protein
MTARPKPTTKPAAADRRLTARAAEIGVRRELNGGVMTGDGREDDVASGKQCVDVPRGDPAVEDLIGRQPGGVLLQAVELRSQYDVRLSRVWSTKA